jgi:hypothetical protein
MSETMGEILVIDLGPHLRSRFPIRARGAAGSREGVVASVVVLVESLRVSQA